MVRTALWSWAAMIAASTVLIHQHHVLDVATGWLLALICVRKIFFRMENLLPHGRAGISSTP